MAKIVAFIFSLALVGSFYAFAATTIAIKNSASQGDVQFEAIGKPSMLKVKGKGEAAISALKIEDNKLNGEIHFKLDTLNTGIDLRDSHMKEKYLQVKEYPEAVLTFKDFMLPATWTLKNPIMKDVEFTANLKLHDVEKSIKGKIEIKNEKLASQADFEIKLSDYKIEIPVYLGVKIADIVKVTVNFSALDAVETSTLETPTPKKK